MIKHDKETAFLKRVIVYDEAPERYELEERIAQAQRNEHCVRRATALVAFIAALAAAGLGYSAVILPDVAQSTFTARTVVTFFAVLGLGSLICLVGYLGCWMVHRWELARRQEEGRVHAARFLEARLGGGVVREP